MTPGARRAVRGLLALVVLGLLLSALGRMDLQRVAHALETARGSWLAASLLCYAAILPLWAAEWRLLAPPSTPPTTLRRMLEVVTMTSSILNTTSLLVGEATGIVLLVTHAGVTRAAAVSVLAMDQLLVGLGKIAVLSAAAALLPLPPWMSRGIVGLVTAIAVLLLALSVGAWRHAELERAGARVLPARWAAALGALGRALSPLRSPPRACALVLLALVKKGAEVLAVLCVQSAFGLWMPAAAVLVVATLSLATLLPIVPGDVGVYEGAVVLSYASQGVPAEHALAMAVVQHACSFAALALPGYWWLVRRPGPMRVGENGARPHAAD